MGHENENGVLGTGEDAEEKGEHRNRANTDFPFSTAHKAPGS